MKLKTKEKQCSINILPTEKQEQATFVDWLRFNQIKHSSIPNSTWTPSIQQKINNKNMGLCPGLPDLLIFLSADQCRISKSILLFIEMKRIKGGIVSGPQVAWIERLNTIENVEARVCYGCDEAIEFVSKFLLTYIKPC